MVIDIPQYIHQCAPNIAQSTMQAIIKTESKGNPIAIGLNKGYKLKFQPVSNKQAIAWVKYLEQHGYNFDVGLAQVNIKNIHSYGYNAVDALNPCINLKIASRILKKNYLDARNNSGSDQEALKKTISAYNTGNYQKGFSNGYVQKVYANATRSTLDDSVPSISNNLIAENIFTESTSEDPRKSKSILYVRPRNAANSFY
jgi:type IV secretion system protein VirB1